MAQLHGLHGQGHTLRLSGVEGRRFGGAGGTECAGAGAHLPAYHERGGAVRPALPAVRALRLPAHRDEPLLPDEVVQLAELLPMGQGNLQPGRLVLCGGAHAWTL